MPKDFGYIFVFVGNCFLENSKVGQVNLPTLLVATPPNPLFLIFPFWKVENEERGEREKNNCSSDEIDRGRSREG